MFAVKRDTDEPALCLVAAIEDYVGAALEAGWNISVGYLFRDVQLHVPWEDAPPLNASKASTILQQWLAHFGMPDNVSIHGTRAGGALYRHFQGEEIEDIMLQAYWKRPETAEHYLQLFRMANFMGSEELVRSEEQYRITDSRLREVERLTRLLPEAGVV